MYSNFLNHYYLSNVHHAAVLHQTREHLTNIFFGKQVNDETAGAPRLENVTLVELDRVWLSQLNSKDDANGRG